MPKMKSHRSSAKRFRLTGTGKLVRRRAGKKHLNVGKAESRTRALSVPGVVSEEDDKRVRLALPYPQYLK